MSELPADPAPRDAAARAPGRPGDERPFIAPGKITAIDVEEILAKIMHGADLPH